MMIIINNIAWVEPMHQTAQAEVDSTMPATDETRKILPIFLVVLIDVLGLMIILPLLPFYSEQFGATPFVVGMLISSYALCQLVSAPPLGRWSDHVGRKPLLIVKTRRVVSVCMPHFDRDELTTFEVDHVTLEFLRKDQVLRNLAGIACIPETRDEFW